MTKQEILIDKVQRKLHCIFWQKLRPGKWALYLYPAYRRGKRWKRSGTVPDRSHLYLTARPNKGAGIGHQMANWNAGLWFADIFQVHHAYIPFASAQWDDFLGFGVGEITAKELLKGEGYVKRTLPYFSEKKEEDMRMIQQIIDSYSGRKVVFYLERDQIYWAQCGVIPQICERFRQAPARKQDHLIFNPDELTIALHIRRGDIANGDGTGAATSMQRRWLEVSYYHRVLEQLLPLIQKEQKYVIYVFSQGKEGDFAELQDFPNLRFCLDMSARDSFLHMVNADILVTSKSSFSYKPALLSEGIKICPENFWHEYPKERHWVLASDEGTIPESGMEQLKGLL